MEKGERKRRTQRGLALTGPVQPPHPVVLAFVYPPWNTAGYKVLPPFQNIRCFSFVKQMYLDMF
jgi:hypothetical protein